MVRRSEREILIESILEREILSYPAAKAALANSRLSTEDRKRNEEIAQQADKRREELSKLTNNELKAIKFNLVCMLHHPHHSGLIRHPDYPEWLEADHWTPEQAAALQVGIRPELIGHSLAEDCKGSHDLAKQYLNNLKSINETLSTRNAEVIGRLNPLCLVQFWINNNEVLPEELKAAFEALGPDPAGGLFKKKFLSDNIDYSTWGHTANWSELEAVLLVCGIPPVPGGYDESEIISFERVHDAAKQFKRVRFMVRRAVHADEIPSSGGKIRPDEFLSWCLRSNIDVPDELCEAVEAHGHEVRNWKAAYDDLASSSQAAEWEGHNPDNPHFNNELHYAVLGWEKLCEGDFNTKYHTVRQEAEKWLKETNISKNARARILTMLNQGRKGRGET